MNIQSTIDPDINLSIIVVKLTSAFSEFSLKQFNERYGDPETSPITSPNARAKAVVPVFPGKICREFFVVWRAPTSKWLWWDISPYFGSSSWASLLWTIGVRSPRSQIPIADSALISLKLTHQKKFSGPLFFRNPRSSTPAEACIKLWIHLITNERLESINIFVSNY